MEVAGVTWNPLLETVLDETGPWPVDALIMKVRLKKLIRT